MEKRKSGLILMGDLPRGGMASFLWVTYPGKKTWRSGRVVMGDLPRKNVGFIVMGDLPKWKNGKNGLIMMGDLPRWKECEMRSHCNG